MKKTITKWFAFAAVALLSGLGVAYALPLLNPSAKPSLSTDVEELYVKEGETKAITVQLNQAEQKVYGVTADIQVPEDFEVEVEEVEIEGATTVVKELSSGAIRVLVYSATPFPAEVTDVFKINVTPENEDAEGLVILSNPVVNYDVEGAPIDYELADIYVGVYEGIAPPKNLDFEDDDAQAAGIRTYARDITPNSDETASATAVSGWTVAQGGLTEDSSTNNDKKGDGVAAGTFAYGSTAFLGGPTAGTTACVAPAADPDGDDVGQALGLLAVWTNTVQYTQEVVLEAGDYALEIPVYNTVGASAIVKNLMGVIVDGEELFAETTQYPVGEWETEYVLFTVEEEMPVTISLGYASANAGSGAMPHLFVDGVNIMTGDEYEEALLEVAKGKAIDALNELPVSPDVFCYPEPVVTEALAEVEDAETPEDVAAILLAVEASKILPYDEKTPYTIMQASSGMYLNIASAAVTLSDEPQLLYFVEGEKDGAYYITDGTRFIGLTSTNKWNMPTEPDLMTLVTPEATVNAGVATVTLEEANGFIGSDETTVNSKCYADKAADAENSQWIVKREASEFVVLDESLDPDKYKKGWWNNKVLPDDWTINNGITVDNFHCNCWSNEADPSGMKVPFVEYWFGAGTNMANATISHTQLVGLAPGTCKVEITARVFNENNSDVYPEGVKFVANDDEVDLKEEGTNEVWHENANKDWTEVYGTFELEPTIEDDGTLDIKFEVAAAKGNWLAFKNLKVTCEAAPDVIKEERYVNEPTAELQDDAVDYFSYYRTPETYQDAVAAVANAKEVADFYEANADVIADLSDEGKEIFEAAEETATSVEELQAALDEAKKAKVEPGDVTYLVVNNSFETGDLTGWVVVNQKGDTGVKPNSDDTYHVNNADGNYIFNTWSENAPGCEQISQTIPNMPAGKYILKALYASDGDATIELFANDASVELVTPGDKKEAIEGELEFTLEKKGDITIGMKNASIWYKADNFRLEYLGEEGEEPVEDGLVEIPQDQGKDIADGAGRTDLVEGDEYNTYTTNTDGDIEVAFKMVDIDVTGCDYVIVKFAEPVSEGWSIAFGELSDLSNEPIPGGSTEFKHDLAPGQEVLPQLTILSLWKPAGLSMKVTGVYKHMIDVATDITKVEKAAAKNGKYIENNAVVIYKNGKKFNVAGQAIK